MESPLNRLDLFTKNKSVISETIKLLQLMIRTDTTNPPGNEIVLVNKLNKIIQKEKYDYLDTKIIETEPKRGNLIFTIKGTDPSNNPTWGFHGHLDVVNAKGDWKYPPFSGKLVKLESDRFIWGRGALDMKNQCTAQLMAALLLLREGWRPKGNVRLIFTADEESGGQIGAEKLVNEHYDDVNVDCMIDEMGGQKTPFGSDFLIVRGEKGKFQMELTFFGNAGHGSMPTHLETYAIYKLAKILNLIRKRRQPLHVSSHYKQTIDALSLPKILKFILKRKHLLRPVFLIASKIMKIDVEKLFISILTNTITPTIIEAGEKVNVIPPEARLSVDMRILPGETEESILESLKKKFGLKIFNEIEITPTNITEATISPINTSFYEKIDSVMKKMYTGANLVPILGVGGSDSKFWRKKGIPCYGFSPFIIDEDNDLLGLIHAPDERISVTNLMFATEFAYRLMKEL